MSRAISTPVAVTLDRASPDPLPVQVAHQVRRLVASGALAAGQRLPSTRALAVELGVARGVVEAAYDQLLAESWVTSRRGAGTFVGEVGPGRTAPARTGGTPSGRRARSAARRPRVSFDTGTPYVDPRLEPGWRRAWREMAAATPPRGYPEPAGIPQLRELLAGYVSRHRGLTCEPAQVLVTSGTTHGITLALGCLERGAVAVEDPGYRAAVAVSRAAGFDVVDVPVDHDGIDVAALAAVRRDDVGAIYVTPAHQHPTGATLSAARRMALIAEARRRSAWILEDDYDSEFRYDVAPLPALASLAPADVIYLGTAAKAVHPGLRIGWLVGPTDLVASLAEAAAARHDHPSWPAQRAFVAMLRDGHVDRLIRSARRVYADRGQRIRARLGDRADVQGAGAGMYVTVVTTERAAKAVCVATARAGFDVPLLATYGRSRRAHGIMLGFGGVTDDELDRCLDIVETVLSGA